MRRVVIDLIGVHRPYDAKFVSDGLGVRQQVADHLSAQAAPGKREGRAAGPQAAPLMLELRELLSLGESGRKRLAVQGVQLRLGVERL